MGFRAWMGVVLLTGCLGHGRAREHGLQSPGPFHDGRVRGTGVGDFAYDKWFEVKGVSLPPMLLGRGHEGNLLDCLRPGSDRYLVVFRSYVGLTAEGKSTGVTFYLLIRRDGRGELDLTRAVISNLFDAEAAAAQVWAPTKVEISGDRMAFEARARDLGEAPAHFEIEGRQDLAFGWEDYVKRRREVAAEAGDDPTSTACRLTISG